jgi:hypothetical protein
MDKENKEKLKALESDIKVAFKENRFEQVDDLAKEIKSIDPENHLAVRLLEKMETAKAEAKKKANAEKIKEYQKMISKMLKEGNLENVRKLAEELKEFDPKSSADWMKKAEDAEIKIKQKQNAEKIKEVEKQVKISFKENQFEKVKELADKLKELDPKNKTAEKFVANIEKAKADAQRKQNADKINILQDEIKLAFKENRFDDLGKTANKLFEIDPQNKFAKKYLDKSVKLKAKAKAEVKPEIKPVPVAPIVKAPEVKPVAPLITPKPVAPAVKAPVIPVTPVTPITPKPAAVPVAPAKPKEAAVQAKAPAEEKGNIFTKMFGKKVETEKPEKSIIDTIVAKTAERKPKEKVKKPKESQEEGLAFFKFSRMFLRFAIVFILISAVFFYAENIDENNLVFGLAGIEENYAGRLHMASQTLEEKNDEERELNRNISKYKEGYDNKYELIIQGIIDKRMNWSDMVAKVNEVANAVYERNEISQYIKFDSYSFDVDTGQIRVSGSLSDPLGKNLTKLVELEEAFKYYPKDPNNPDDTTEPYFYDFQEFNSLSKSYNKKTGEYTSSFSLSFSLKPNK